MKNNKKDIVQYKNPRTGLYVKKDRVSGKIVQKKKSEGPFSGVPIQRKHKKAKNKVAKKTKKKTKKTKKTKKSKIGKSIIICSKCKTEKKTTKKQLERLVSKFGSLVDVFEKYHCIECRRTYNVTQNGRPKRVSKKRKPKSNTIASLPPIHETSWGKKKCVGGIRQEVKLVKPKGVSKTKWNKAIKESIAWAKKEGIIHPIR